MSAGVNLLLVIIFSSHAPRAALILSYNFKVVWVQRYYGKPCSTNVLSPSCSVIVCQSLSIDSNQAWYFEAQYTKNKSAS